MFRTRPDQSEIKNVFLIAKGYTGGAVDAGQEPFALLIFGSHFLFYVNIVVFSF
jgi:hypothetical protein